jgi:hypothetical protein
MERLTFKLPGSPFAGVKDSAPSFRDYDHFWKHAMAINLLNAYEDTNLTPAEITALQAELAAYRADEQEGRIVRVARCVDCALGERHFIDKGIFEAPECDGVRCIIRGVVMDFTSFCHCGETRNMESARATGEGGTPDA